MNQKTMDELVETYSKGFMAFDSSERQFVKNRIRHAILEAVEPIEKELTNLKKINHNNADYTHECLELLREHGIEEPDDKPGEVDQVEQLRKDKERLIEALRKAVAWADSMSMRITEKREDINWTYLRIAEDVLHEHQRTAKGSQ